MEKCNGKLVVGYTNVVVAKKVDLRMNFKRAFVELRKWIFQEQN
jgi:hypothetical protein